MNVYDDIVKGLEEAIAFEKGKGNARVQKRIVNPIEEFTSAQVKEIRKSLKMSQSVFAVVMGVSIKTVEAWEAGTNKPNGSARRLLHVLKTDPEILTRCNILA